MGADEVRSLQAPHRGTSHSARGPRSGGEGGDARLTISPPVAHFESFADGRGWNASFRDPVEQRVARTLDEVIPLLRRAEAAAGEGLWVALALAYEAAPAFDSDLEVKPSAGFPLAWMAAFTERAEAKDSPDSDSPYQVSELEPALTGEQYRRAIHAIRDYIESGDTYQVNFTFPLRGSVCGDSFRCFRSLAQSERPAYASYLDIGSHRILSFSPELFVERRGSKLITRPMKGTMSRGRGLEEDIARARDLSASVKDRAENVMIVDLMRSDLGKVAQTGSVAVENLFTVESLGRVLQMTSTVTAVQRPDVTVVDILTALFPCGSVTGAPKSRSMQIISELEQAPRGIYTGAIGLLNPDGDAVFSVPIRTLSVEKDGTATFGVGGAITWDSTAEGEYDECRLKSKFLTDPWPEFDLLETMSLRDGEYWLLDRHLRRARDSARYFGFRWNDDVLAALEDLRALYGEGNWRVRLTVERDGNARTQVVPLVELGNAPRLVKFASRAIDDRDPLVFHKTTARARYDSELERCQPCDDVIFWNDRGEVTESTIANVVVFSDGKYWTPPSDAGLLAGTLRNELIAKGELFERTITKAELARAESFFLINSVRGWTPALLTATERVRAVSN